MIFSPRNLYLPREDKVMKKIYAVRGWIGMAIIVVTGLRYTGPKSLYPGLMSWANAWVPTAKVAVMLVFAFGVVIVTVTRPGFRWAAAWQFRWPVIAIAAAPALIWLLNTLRHLIVRSPHWHINPIIRILFILWSIMLMLCLLLYTAYGLYQACAGFCRASDAHPLLGPIVGPLTLWFMALYNLEFNSGSGPVPPMISLTITLGGPASMTILGIIEILRLRHCYPADFPFLEGPIKNRKETVTTRAGQSPNPA